MSWSPQWEEIFQTKDWGRYPSEHVVRFVARSFYKVADRSTVNILELGCGPGANLWFMAREGFTVHGIDGAPTAIEQAARRLAGDKLRAGSLKVGDILHLGEAYVPSSMDAIIDVNCLQCSPQANIVRIVRQAFTALKPGGRIFSILMATGSWGEGLGREIAPRTWTEIKEGPCSDSVINHFANEDDIAEAFGQFGDLQIEWARRSFQGGQQELKHWLISGTKPA